MRRVGIVGLGLMGTHHWWVLNALHSAGITDAVVTSAYDIDAATARRFADDTGVALAPDVDRLVDDCDVMWVCTWTAGHLPAVQAAARKNRPVFVEKPLAPTLPDCEQLTHLLAGVPHQVGLILRHAPAYALLADEIGSGRYGRPMGAYFRDDQYFPIGGTYGSTWRSNVAHAGGGTLIEHSIHDVDVLLWLLGYPTSVSAQTSAFAEWPGIEDMASVRLEFAAGHSAALLSVWHQVTTRPTNRRIEVFCEEAVLWMDGEAGPVHIETASGTDVRHAPMPDLVNRIPLDHVPETWRLPAAGLSLQAKAFLDALAAGDPAGHPTVVEALAAHRVVDAAYRSAASGGAPIALQPTSDVAVMA